MTSAICPFCEQLNLDLERVETELEFLLENMPYVEEGSAEGRRAYLEFQRVEGDLDQLEQAYNAHRESTRLHILEDRVLLN